MADNFYSARAVGMIIQDVVCMVIVDVFIVIVYPVPFGFVESVTANTDIQKALVNPAVCNPNRVISLKAIE